MSTKFNKNIKLFFITMMSLCFCKCAEVPNSTTNMEVLIITDDRKFNREAYFEMFNSFENINITNITNPDIFNIIGTDSIKRFDAIVFYDMPEQVILTETQKQKFIKFFREGAPAIFLHHTLLSYREWDEFPNIIGGRFYNKSALITQHGDTLQAVYQHDVNYKVNIVNRNHPITLGMDDFEILDETYNNYFVKNNVEVLITTQHSLSGLKLGWINTYGVSKIVYLLNGHNETAFENSNYRKLLYNAIRWVAEQKNNNFHDDL